MTYQKLMWNFLSVASMTSPNARLVARDATD
jgi:hypothetical protein